MRASLTRPVRPSLAGLAALLAGAIIAAGFFPVPPTAPGVSAEAPYRFDSEASSMSIAGTSSLHDWTCEVQNVTGRLTAEIAEAGEGAGEGAGAGKGKGDAAAQVPLKGLPSVEVQVPVEQIECGKSRMNSNLRDALKANAYPTIFFRLDGASVAPLPDSAGAWFRVEASGELIIAGSRRSVTLDVRGERLDDGRLRFTGETPLKMSDFDVEPPSFMLGAVRTGDEVTVRFDVIARKA